MPDAEKREINGGNVRREVLDHGFIELIDVMGDWREVSRAARISYGEVERTEEADLKLIKYLWENYHTTPFEMVEMKWRVKMPIFVARQWVRHRTANINEFSMRYADPTKLSESDKIDYYTPEVWREPTSANKQGSVIDLTITDDEIYTDAIENAISAYKLLQQRGIANEMARMVLPVAVYTEWIWKNDFWNTAHFLKLRADSHAQWEMQEYARAMIDIMENDERLAPLMQIVTKRDA